MKDDLSSSGHEICPPSSGVYDGRTGSAVLAVNVTWLEGVVVAGPSVVVVTVTEVADNACEVVFAAM